jgi:HEAT repeat protein
VSALSRVLQVRPGEGRTVALVVGLMFVSVATLTIGESGINALFFDRVGPDELPTMYLLQGAVGVVGMLVLSGTLGRFDRRRAYVALPLVLAATVVAERAALAGAAAWIYRALWLTITVAYLLQAVYLWGTAGLVSDTRTAKRLFPLFGAGSILGAVVGGLGTSPLAAALGAENLLLVWAAGLLASSALCAAVLGVRRGRSRRVRRRRRPSALAELRQGFGFVRRSPLLVWMALASILFSVLYYSLYQPYAQAATERFPDPDALAGFFGLFWAAVTAGAFIVSIVLANRLLGWFGAAAMILVLPVLYLGAFGLLLVTSTFAMLVAIRFGVNLWLQGVSSPAWETLINVTPEHRRDQSRAFLNGGPAQVGTAIAGLVLLIGQDSLTPRQLAVIGLVTAVATVVVAWRIRGAYTTALVDAIRAGRPRVFDDPIPNAPIAIRHDRQAVELATTAMGDEDPRMRRLACDLLASIDDVEATRALHTATRDPDGLVRARAVEALAADDRLELGEHDDALDDDDARVRLAAVRALGDRVVPAALLRDADPSVAAAAAVRLLEDESPEATRTLTALLSDGDSPVRLEAVRALRDAPARRALDLLRGRLDDPSPGVRAAALDVLAAADPTEAGPAAIAALAFSEPTVRDAALRALDRLDRAAARSAVEPVVRDWTAVAIRDGSTAASVTADGEVAALLRDALLARARTGALVALSAASVVSADRAAVRLAVQVLEDGGGPEIANALETLDAAVPWPSVRPLLRLWEPATPAPQHGREVPDAALSHEDPFVRACAELARSTGHEHEGDAMARSHASLAPMELVLVLRRIPLFAALEPAELLRIAAIAEERSYAHGELLGAEGELGDEMHIVVEGIVRVIRGDGGEVARRGIGDVVGEMSLITREPRVASLVAEGDVRTLRIGQREFEGMVRERPDIALAVMRVLAQRLGSATIDAAPSPAPLPGV